MWHGSQGCVNRRPFTPFREPTTDQVRNTAEVQLAKPLGFIGVTYRNRKDSKAVVLPEPTPEWVVAPRAEGKELTAQPAGSSVRPSIIQAAWLISAPSLPSSLASLPLLGRRSGLRTALNSN